MSRIEKQPQRAATREQRGSVLIFVVGVLLLLAIVATAFLGSSRSDRTATQQNAYNTQVDLLLEGVLNTIRGAILADARFQSSTNQYDAPIAFTAGEEDKFIASRVPMLLKPGTAANAGTNPPLWPAITGPYLDSTFSFPFDPAIFAGNPLPTYTMRLGMVPTTIVPTAGPYQGKVLPAFQYDSDNNLSTGFQAVASTIVPAMDTDNDGVADAGMVKLPIGPIAGVTYYYGARVVDLNSAINANTAWTSNDPSVVPVAPQYNLLSNLYPSNIDLQGLLVGTAAQRAAQMDSLNVYRSNSTTTTPSFNLTPVDDASNNRPDFTFSGTNLTSVDALWNQLGRRLANPASNTVGVAGRLYQALNINSATQLFSGFVLRPAGGSATELENRLTASLTGSIVPSKPYVPAAGYAIGWYNDNFNFPISPVAGPQSDPTMPARALLTTTNAVGNDNSGSSRAVVKEWQIATALVPFYKYGDVVSYTRTIGANTSVVRNYVCLASHVPAAANRPDTIAGMRYWGLLSWSQAPQKADVNVADFGELWWNFRRVMAKEVGSTDTRLGEAPIPAGATKYRQFRTTIRDPNMTGQFPAPPVGSEYLTPSEILQIRTAAAAVNAMDLRDGDTNVTGRQIETYDFPSIPLNTQPAARHVVTVFGTEMQPYITEVYVNNDSGTVPQNPMGYIAIELFNPYPVDMNLGGWSLGMIDRSARPLPPPAYKRAVTPILPAGYPSGRFIDTDSVIVPANGYLILENFSTAPTDLAADAKRRPTEVQLPATGVVDSSVISTTVPMPVGTTVVTKYISQLSRVLTGATATGFATPSPSTELVLLRPRKWAPTGLLATTLLTVTTAGTPEDAQDPCDEGTAAVPNLSDWIPVDSFDFSGIAVAPPVSPNFSLWHYARQHDTAANRWKCTHGGPFLNSAAGTLHQGEGPLTFPAGSMPTAPPVTFTPSNSTLALGAADTIPSFTDTFTPTQINNTDWPSPRRATIATDNQTSFGGFATQTDILQIPFIGSYTVRAPGYLAGEIVEMVALPMDFGYADDQDEGDPAPLPIAGNDNAYEQVGRFCTLATLNPVEYANTNSVSWSDPALLPLPDWYNFSSFSANPVDTSRSIFDLFTTQSPQNRLLPNVSADAYAAAILADPTTTYPAGANTVTSDKLAGVAYSSATTVTAVPPDVTGQANLTPYAPGSAAPIANYYQKCLVQVLTGPARGATEVVISSANRTLRLAAAIPGFIAGDAFRILGTPDESSGTQGLININTAPWPVLARLPLAFTATGVVDHARSEEIARQIVLYRDGDNNPPSTYSTAQQTDARRPHGPFKSIVDLNRMIARDASATLIPYFQTAAGQATPLVMTGTDYGNVDGDLTPMGAAAADGVTGGDFETRYLALSRIANLITTRSDAFAVYVVLQGWKDAGTPNATMVTQRRASLILDRNSATAQSPKLDSTKIPGN